MLKTFLFTALAANLVALSVFAEDISVTVTSDTDATAIFESLAQGSNRLAMNFMFQHLSSGSDQIISPISIVYALGMTAMIRESGSDVDEILKTLNVESLTQMESALATLATRANAEKDEYLTEFFMEVYGDSNKIYSDTLVTLAATYGVEAAYANYTNRAEAAAAMSALVQTHTSNDASDIVVESNISEVTRAVVLSTYNLETYWADSLTVAEAGTQAFTKATGDSVDTDFKAITGSMTVGTVEDYNGQYAIIPLEGDLELVIISTTDDANNYDLRNIIYLFESHEEFTTILSQGETKSQTVNIPASTLEWAGRHHTGLDMKTTGQCHSAMSPDTTRTCTNVYQSGTDCGHISIITEEVSMAIKSKTTTETTERRRRDTTDTETTDSDTTSSAATETETSTSSSDVLTFNRPHVYGIRCSDGFFAVMSTNLGR